MNTPETYSYGYVPATGTWQITVSSPTASTLGETVTAYARAAGEASVTLGTCAGAVAGTTLTITTNSTGLTPGITYEIVTKSPLETLMPNDRDGRYFIRIRDEAPG